MNESRSSRYHRAKRRAGVCSVAVTATLFAVLLVTRGSTSLRDLARDSVTVYVLLLACLETLVTMPIAWYRTCHLERQFGLTHLSIAGWARDYAKSAAVAIAVAIVAAECVYLAIRSSPVWWWVLAAASSAAVLTALTSFAPVFILPLFGPSRPLDRERLQRRLVDLSARAGVAVLSVHEWRFGERTRRANAALVGAGATRRILLSDTLLAEYSDDEIEAVMAHEIGHHVHRDVLKGLAAEFTVLIGAFYVAAVALRASWQPLGFHSVGDVAGLPVIVLAAGAVALTAMPLLNAWSRRNERHADRFALELISQPDAFVGAIRRMAAQNMAEERPPVAARWFFNTHPGVEERIVRAREFINSRNQEGAADPT